MGEPPSASLAAIAAAPPLVAVLATIPLLGLVANRVEEGGSLGALANIFQEAGPAAYAALATSLLCAVGGGGVVYASIRSARLPPSTAGLLAVLPWLIGVLGMWSGVASGLEAVPHASPADRGIILSAVYGEAAMSWLIGATLAAALWAGLTLSLLVGAVAQRDGGPRVAFLGALGATAALAAFSFVRALHIGATAGAYRASAHIAPSDRATLFASAAGWVRTLERTQSALLLAVLVLIVVAVALTATRGARGSAAVGGLLLVATLAGGGGADALGRHAKTRLDDAQLVVRMPTYLAFDAPTIDEKDERRLVVLEEDGLRRAGSHSGLRSGAGTAKLIEPAPPSSEQLLRELHDESADDESPQGSGARTVHFALPPSTTTAILSGGLRLAAAAGFTRVELVGSVVGRGADGLPPSIRAPLANRVDTVAVTLELYDERRHTRCAEVEPTAEGANLREGATSRPLPMKVRPSETRGAPNDLDAELDKPARGLFVLPRQAQQIAADDDPCARIHLGALTPAQLARLASAVEAAGLVPVVVF